MNNQNEIARLHTQKIHEQKKKEIEDEIQLRSHVQLSESMSDSAVKSFQKNQFELERLQTILRISNETALPIQDVEKLDRLEHSIIDILLDAGAVSLAHAIILRWSSSLSRAHKQWTDA